MPANPFPSDPLCECEAQAILLVGWMFGICLILILLILLMLYLYTKIKEFEPILIVFLFSLVIGVMSLSVIDIPFTPWFQIFFMLFQTIMFLLKAFEYYYSKRG